MGVNKFNCEGYYDPTAYEALTKIEQEAKALRTSGMKLRCSTTSSAASIPPINTHRSILAFVCSFR